MNNNTLYQIKNGDVTLYVQMSFNGTQFDFKALTIEGDGNLYMPCLTDYNRIDLDGRPCVDIGDYLFDKYKALAEMQLGEYLERNISNAIDPSDFKSFWCEAGKQLEFKHNKDLCERRVVDGLVGIKIGNTVCTYNLAANEPAGYRLYYREEDLGTTPMRVFYGDHLAQLLALEQYRRGLAPPVYIELTRLNDFLEGKKSVKLVMKDGGVHEYKHHSGYEICLQWMLCYEPQNIIPFWLDDNYSLNPRFGCKRPLADLAYLQYGKQRFVIDTDALGQFDRREADAA